MQFKSRFLFCTFLVLATKLVFSQTLPVGTPALEENWRRLQVKGLKDINTSFTIRPLDSTSLIGYDSSVFNQSERSKNDFYFLRKKGTIRLLPVTLSQQFNHHHPYGWNDGSMIPSKGYETLVSAGFFSKLGILSVQIRPEFVYAQNKSFPEFPSSHNDTVWSNYYAFLNIIDNPDTYGSNPYAKAFLGQSSIRLNFKKLSFGLSTENLWWGPGIRNSIIMSNNAPGFPHVTFNSSAPVNSAIGSFEWQIISAQLKNSNILPADTSRTFDGQQLYTRKYNGDRYLNGMVITWHPKWTKGLHLGFTRMFYTYQTDLQKLEDYLPIFSSFFKSNTNNEDSKRKDQMLSLFFRLIMPKEGAELYAEFGRNDHSQNLRDFILEPEHARAYIIGFRKIFERKAKADFELFMELTQLQLTPTTRVREQNSWYAHGLVRQGYTHQGQVIGAGIGPGSNSQSIGINWIKGLEKFGVTLERVVHNNDFYFNAFESKRNFGSHWTDISLGLNKNWIKNRFVYTANVSLIRSLNYQWRLKQMKLKKDVTNLHAGLSILYLF